MPTLKNLNQRLKTLGIRSGGGSRRGWKRYGKKKGNVMIKFPNGEIINHRHITRLYVGEVIAYNVLADMVNGKVVSLGCYDSYEEAEEVRDAVFAKMRYQ